MKPFDTNQLFTGGAGFFIEYHDIIKPVYLLAVCKMILMQSNPYGIPFHIISHLPHHSMVEWYIKRNRQNPLYNIDYQHIADIKLLDDIMQDILSHDQSLYRLAPPLNTVRLLSVYEQQHMTFPVYIYSQYEDPFIQEDLREILPTIPFIFVNGDIQRAVHELPDNFSYIFSSIDSLHNSYKELNQKFCHVLLATDYSYNYSDGSKVFRYPLKDYQNDHIRVGMFKAVDLDQLVSSMMHLIE